MIWPCLPIWGGGSRRAISRRDASRNFAVDIEDFRTADRLHEQPADDLVVHRGAHAQNADLPVGQSIPILR